MIKTYSNDSIIYQILDLIPANIYWKDSDGKYLGCNKAVLEMAGLNSREEIIGKTDYDLKWKDFANEIRKVDRIALEDGYYQGEELPAILPDWSSVFMTIKAPLKDVKGKIIGIIGASIDITARKESERLKAENNRHKMEAEAHKAIFELEHRFSQIAQHTVHDIRSPIASLQMLAKSCDSLPESQRVSLRYATTEILDIANHLLNAYSNKDKPCSAEEVRQPVIISLLLEQILSEKKYEYENLLIKFTTNFDSPSRFAFINIDIISFKRMISNLINNAKDAFEGKEGNIQISLFAKDGSVVITIQDSGKGMTPEIIENILNNIKVTDKKDGYGIGLSQVRDTIWRNFGRLDIKSRVGVGTKVILVFPQAEKPRWFADEINFCPSDIIVILDDDKSIHGAWDVKLTPYLLDYVEIMHFYQGLEVIDFINDLSVRDKQRVFLLADYELLKQDLNGMDIIRQTNLKRSIVVTSHHDNVDIRNEAVELKVTLLPKPLAAEVSIYMDYSSKQMDILEEPAKVAEKKVDFIMLDDDKMLLDQLVDFALAEFKVDKFYDPIEFMSRISEYAKDNKIVLDNNYDKHYGIGGVSLAQQLHDMGYTKLYLLSGAFFAKDKLPEYITPIIKNIDGINSLKFI